MPRSQETWDLFISHASEDKEAFVRPLAEELRAFGVRVWYDDFTLKLGDSLSRSIDAGLAKSDFGLVVLSPAFLEKGWPEYELRGLTAREVGGKKVILPIWHNVGRADVLAFSPPLADKLAVSTSSLSALEIAAKIIELVRPDIFSRIMRRVAFNSAFEGSDRQLVDPKTIRSAPVRHLELPPDLVSRIRLIRVCLIEVYPHSMDYWLDGFKRDAHPSREVAWWEHLAAVYQEYLAIAGPLTAEQKKSVFSATFSLGMSGNGAEIGKYGGLPPGAGDILKDLSAYTVPIYDFVDPDKFPDHSPTSDEARELFELDQEHFPIDLPEERVRELTKSWRPKASPKS